MTKVYISSGHGGKDPGAVSGKFIESQLNLAVAKACYNYLKKKGVNVKIDKTKNTSESLTRQINEANAWRADYAVDIHFNAGGGDGAECICSIAGGEGKQLANKVLTQLKAIGQNSRGVKTRQENGKDYFGWIRLTNMPAIIVECGFVDNKKDRRLFDTPKELKAMGEAIAKGIIKQIA